MSEELLIEYSPYFAGLNGKTPEQKQVLENRIEQLSETEKDFLFDSQTSDGIQRALQVNDISEDYAVAVSKIVFLILLKDIPQSSAEQLLSKLDIPQEKARRLTQAISAIFAPLATSKTQEGVHPTSTPTAPREIPPLSHSPNKTESGAAPQNSHQNGSRTIIDLRKAPKT